MDVLESEKPVRTWDSSLRNYYHSMRKSSRYLIVAACLVFLFLYSSSRSHRLPIHDTFQAYAAPKQFPSSHRILSAESIAAIQNKTLGFEKIYMVNLPERSDKRDLTRLAASLTDFHIDVIDGVDGRKIPRVAWPAKEFRENDDRNYGSWRAHMNFADRILSEDLSSALLMEDDADWAPTLRDQLVHFATGSQLILNETAPTPPSPYGSNWDILWLGHCAQSVAPWDNRRFLITNDKTLPARKPWSLWDPTEIISDLDTSTRAVFRSRGGCCIYAYALSKRGAQKMLLHMSVQKNDLAVDNRLHDLCAQERSNFTCVAPFPGIIHTHEPVGLTAGVSDNSNPDHDVEGQSGWRESAMSFNLPYSVKLNIERMLDGKEPEMQKGWEAGDGLEGGVVTKWEDGVRGGKRE